MYTYGIYGGCGSTKMTIETQNNKFRLAYRSKWMGMKKSKRIVLYGTTTKNQNHIILHVNKINNNGEIIENCFMNVHIYELNQDIEFVEFSCEHEAMITGRCHINKNQTYNSIITFDYRHDEFYDEIQNELRDTYHVHNDYSHDDVINDTNDDYVSDDPHNEDE
jgi:hypothetical protein